MRHLFLAAALALGGGAQAALPEWVAAKVIKVEPERSRVTLDHGRIQSIGMDAMVMPFKVEDHLVVVAMETAK